MRKKVISPEQRRRAARAVVASELCSGRAACRFLKVSRSTYWYRTKEPTSQEQRLLKRLREPSEKHGRYGYRRSAVLLRKEGWPVGKKIRAAVAKIHRAASAAHKAQGGASWRLHGAADEGRAPGPCLELGLHLDATTRGGPAQLTILDEYTRECHVLRADRALKSSDVLEWIGRAIAEHGSPAYLRSDNGPEFIAREVQRWLAVNQIKTIYIEPDSPWPNGFVESFHGRLRDECLNREQLCTLTEVRVVIEDYRCQYNHHRPHSKLGNQSLKRFAATTQSAPSRLRAPYAAAGQTKANNITNNQVSD